MKNRKRKKYIKFIAPVLIIICLVAVLAWDLEKTQAPKSENTHATQTATTANQNTNIAENSNPSTVNSLPSAFEIPVLMYHYIRNVDDPTDTLGINLSVSPDKFASQLDLIKADGYTTITFEDIKKGNIPNKPIILTFDDGYRDFYTAAFPELKKRNMTAVSFVVTGTLGGDAIMSKEQVKEISDYGIEIGDHTVHHPDLSKLTYEKSVSEVNDSKKTLEDIIGKPLTTFCYPSGQYTYDTEMIVKKAGFSYAVTTHPGITTFKDPLTLDRYRMNHDTNISTYIK